MYLECNVASGDCCSEVFCTGDWVNGSSDVIDFKYDNNPDHD